MATVTDLIDATIRVTEKAERPDLGKRLGHTRRRVQDPSVRVLVVGEFKQGKSQLINALLGAQVCPVDDDVATSVPTAIRRADEAEATLVLGRKDEAGEPDPQHLTRKPIPVGKLAEYVSESGNPNNERQVLTAEVGLPRALLDNGLVLVDTPGVGGLGSSHAANTMTALPSADAVLLVSDAAQEYSEPELDFLRQAMKLCPNVACVLTKTDLYPQWRRIAELDREHLATAGVKAELFPVSSILRRHALSAESKEINTESGFPELVGYLRRNVVGRAQTLSRRSVSHDVLSVTEQLGLALRSELDALQNPERNNAAVAELERARARADELRKRSARWQTTLNDGVTDLSADIDYDLRDRLRKITREGEEAIDEADPAKMWEDFGQWLDQQVATAVKDNFVWAHERSEWLANQVARHFAEDGGNLTAELRIDDTEGVLEPVTDLEDIDNGKINILSRLLIGMRGSYGGVLMFGVVTTAVAGMALINPISLGAGALIGAKAYRDEMSNRLKRRRGEAKQAVRRQTDDVAFQVGKTSKDRLRQVQRLLRDHYTDMAEELHRSLTDSVNAAQNAAKTSANERDQRVRTIKAELERIDQLDKAARSLTKPAPKAKQRNTQSAPAAQQPASA